MERDKYVQVSMVVRRMELDLLTKERMQTLAGARDYDEALALLQDTPYGKFRERMERKQDYETMLNAALKETYEEVLSYLEDSEVVNILMVKYTLHNLKVFVKSKILKKDLSEIYYSFGLVDMHEFSEEFDRERFSEAYDPYGKAAMAILKDYEENKDPHRVGLLFDQFYFQMLKEVVKPVPDTLMAHYVYDSIDFTNVKTAFRITAKDLTMSGKESALFEGGEISLHDFEAIYHKEIPDVVKTLRHTRIGSALEEGLRHYEETGELAAFDKAMEDYQVKLLAPGRKMTYGPEVVFGFLLAKEIEMRNLRIILAGKLTGLDGPEMTQRLRDQYV